MPAIAYANPPAARVRSWRCTPTSRSSAAPIVVAIPQWLMVVMLHSGLFDAWRMPIATGISYFGDAAGGALSFWPDGATGMVELIEPHHNMAVVTDTDRAFHGVDRVGAGDEPAPPVASGMVMVPRTDGGWTLRDGDAVAAEYGPGEVRFSVSWKAYCFADEDERGRMGNPLQTT